jgi:hypothetical protein
MHDAADDAAIVHPLDAPDIPRQLRFDPLPLLIVQPKQVPAHDPNPLPKTNQDRIVRAEKLMSSDPNHMAETKSAPKSLYDLAKALDRWDDEGGAAGSSRADLGPALALHAAEERVLRCLGAAVIMQWNDLPTEIQRKLFEDATSMNDSARQFELKQLIARFLHEHKDDA